MKYDDSTLWQTTDPTPSPSNDPTIEPTEPTKSPSGYPTIEPTLEPTIDLVAAAGEGDAEMTLYDLYSYVVLGSVVTFPLTILCLAWCFHRDRMGTDRPGYFAVFKFFGGTCHLTCCSVMGCCD